MCIQNLVKMLNKTRIMTEWENDRTMDAIGQIFFQSGTEEGKQQWIEKNECDGINTIMYIKILSLNLLKS